MKILAGVSDSEYIQFKKQVDELIKNKVDCKLIKVKKTYFLSRNPLEHLRWKKHLRNNIKKFKPDFIFADYTSDLCIEAIHANIPLLLYVRGDFWQEREDFLNEIILKQKSAFKSLIKKIHAKSLKKQTEECFEKASLILPVCKYLENIIKKKYSNKTFRLFLVGIDPNDWFADNGMKIKKPAVGLVQNTLFWKKTEEMLVLKNVLESLPQVNFYWAGSGIHTSKIIEELGKYENFIHLGGLQYPDEIRKFLNSVDIYVLLSGLDMLPKTLIEAQMMEKPVIGTNIGGIPEAMINNKTGFLVEEGNWEDLMKKIRYLLENPKVSYKMGKEGRLFAINNFSTKIRAQKLISYCQELKPEFNVK